MSCNPNMCRNSLWLSALMAPKIQSHSIKRLMLRFWELNPRSKQEKPQHGALCTGKCLYFPRGYLEHHRNKPDSAIANGWALIQDSDLGRDKPRQHIKKQRHHFADKGPYSQSYGFSSSHVQMWELDHKEGWALKYWCFWTVVLEKTLEILLDSKEIKPVNTKGNQPWIFIGRTDAETQALILWPPDVKSWLTEKGPDAGKDWRQKERGTTEDDTFK